MILKKTNCCNYSYANKLYSDNLNYPYLFYELERNIMLIFLIVGLPLL